MTAQKFDLEEAARRAAVEQYPDEHIVIIESRGEFHLEHVDDYPMLRNFEREAYSGRGRYALPKGYGTCQRCGLFFARAKRNACHRCGQEFSK